MCNQHADFLSTIFKKHIIAAIPLHNMVTRLKDIFTIGPITQIFRACFEQGIIRAEPNSTVLSKQQLKHAILQKGGNKYSTVLRYF